MGLLDRAKAGLSNAGNYTSQKADEASFNSKINDQKSIKCKSLEEAGNKMYVLYKDGSYVVSDEVKALFDKAIECDAEIARLETEKAEMIAKYEGERQTRREQVAAAEEKERAEREAAKAAEKKQ